MTHVLDQISVTTDPSSYMPSNFSGLFSDLSLRYRFLGSSIVHKLQVTRHRDSEYQDPTRATSLSSMPHGRGHPHLSTQTSKLTKVPLNISIQDLIPSQQSPSQPRTLTSSHLTLHHITSHQICKPNKSFTLWNILKFIYANHPQLPCIPKENTPNAHPAKSHKTKKERQTLFLFARYIPSRGP